MNRIKELRKQKRLAQKELAKQLEVNQSSLSEWEKGSYRPNEKQLLKLCDFFNCTSDYLLGYVDINLKEPESNDNTITVYGRDRGQKTYKVSAKRLAAIQALLEEDSSDDFDF